MDIAFIEQLIALHQRTGLAELEYSADGHRIRLFKATDCSAAAMGDSPAPSSPESTSTWAVASGAEMSTVDASRVPKGAAVRVVKAPLAGIFYQGPAPGEPPYVQTGAHVKEGQMLAVIDAMKVLNAVESEWAGRVLQILARDGVAVAPGDDLLLIEVQEDRNV